MRKILLVLLVVASCGSHEEVEIIPTAMLGESCVSDVCDEGLSCNSYTLTCSSPCESSSECSQEVGDWGNCWLFPEQSDDGQCLPECTHDATVCGEACTCTWLAGFPPLKACVCE